MSTNEKLRKQRKRLWEKQRGKCYWCEQKTRLLYITDGKVPKDAATIDHLDSRLNANRGNFNGFLRHVMACWKCNNDRANAEVAALPLSELQSRSSLHKKA
jgi:hypothetical protein